MKYTNRPATLTRRWTCYGASIASIIADGGHTFNLNDCTIPRAGYVYAPSKATEAVFGKLDNYIIKRFIRVNAHRLTEHSRRCLGIWRNPDGKWVLDVVVVDADLARALSHARLARQDAIFDLGGNCAIPCNSTPESWAAFNARVGA